MSATLRTTLALALAATIVTFNSPSADAQPPRPKLLPPGGGPSVPYLGFDSYFAPGGEHVTNVHYGSPAEQMGLEPGDRILAVNGVRLRYDGHWYQLVQRAAYQGHVTLAIRDWRSGQVAYRSVSLGGGNPIRPKSREHGGGHGHRRSFVEITLPRIIW